MNFRFLTILILTSSTYAVAAQECSTIVEKEQGFFISKTNKVAYDHENYSISKLQLKNYCVFYGSTPDSENKAVLFNKNNGFSYSVDHFFTAQQSPNKKLVSVLSGNDDSSMNSIAILDEKGLVPYNASLQSAFNFDREYFYGKFSADSKYFLFEQYIEDTPLNYVALNLENGQLTAQLTRIEDHQDALSSSPHTRDSEFAFIVPVSDTSFAARSQNGYLAYYQNKIALWTVETGSVQPIAVGNVYVVVLNRDRAIDLYRKKDGKKYTTKNFLKTKDTSFWILDSRFIDDDNLLIKFRGDEENQTRHILVNLTKKTVKELP